MSPEKLSDLYRDIGFIKSRIDSILDLLKRVEETGKESLNEQKEDTIRIAAELKEETFRIATELKERTSELQERIDELRTVEVSLIHGRLNKLESRHELIDAAILKKVNRNKNIFKWTLGIIAALIPLFIKKILDNWGWITRFMPR